MSLNKQLLITSVNKAIQRAKKTGAFDLSIHGVVEMLVYYIDWTDAQILLGFNGPSIVADNRTLKDLLTKLKYEYPNIICNYKHVTPSSSLNVNPTNTAPTIDDNTIYLSSDTQYQFSYLDFTVNYADAENHGWKYIIVDPADLTDGQLIYRTMGTPGTDFPYWTVITAPYTIDISTDTQYINLFYRRTTATEPNQDDTFQYRISDNPVNYLYSISHTMSVNLLADPNNNLPIDTLGDNTLYAFNRAVTVLTFYMFVGGLKAPYNDPEGDALDAIRITNISGGNLGIYKLNGSPITEGLIISVADIQGGLFTHEAPNQDAVNSDVFEFQARDSGSLIWVD